MLCREPSAQISGAGTLQPCGNHGSSPTVGFSPLLLIKKKKKKIPSPLFIDGAGYGSEEYFESERVLFLFLCSAGKIIRIMRDLRDPN